MSSPSWQPPSGALSVDFDRSTEMDTLDRKEGLEKGGVEQRKQPPRDPNAHLANITLDLKAEERPMFRLATEDSSAFRPPAPVSHSPHHRQVLRPLPRSKPVPPPRGLTYSDSEADEELQPEAPEEEMKEADRVAVLKVVDASSDAETESEVETTDSMSQNTSSSAERVSEEEEGLPTESRHTVTVDKSGWPRWGLGIDDSLVVRSCTAAAAAAGVPVNCRIVAVDGEPVAAKGQLTTALVRKTTVRLTYVTEAQRESATGEAKTNTSQKAADHRQGVKSPSRESDAEVSGPSHAKKTNADMATTNTSSVTSSSIGSSSSSSSPRSELGSVFSDSTPQVEVDRRSEAPAEVVEPDEPASPMVHPGTEVSAFEDDTDEQLAPDGESCAWCGVSLPAVKGTNSRAVQCASCDAWIHQSCLRCPEEAGSSPCCRRCIPPGRPPNETPPFVQMSEEDEEEEELKDESTATHFIRENKIPLCAGFSTFMVIAVIIAIVLLSLSFKKVEANQVGFMYDEATMKLGSEPHFEGLYEVGPSGTFITFPTTQITWTFSTACTSSDGIPMSVKEEVAYTLTISKIRTEVIDLWGEQAALDDFLREMFQSQTITACSRFTLREFWTERHLIQQEFYASIQEEAITLPINLATVQLLDIQISPDVKYLLLNTTVSEQDVVNAQVERSWMVLQAEIALNVTKLRSTIILMDAERDATEIRTKSDQDVLVERAKMGVYTATFKNLSDTLKVSGRFFINDYLPITVFQQSLEGHRVMQLQQPYN